ncbi:hypothetical protein CJI97_005636 [Candidozyma auris]|nr:hypothetical protein CJI97_005636 [[Candida] auris]
MDPKARRRVALITAANSGVGWHTSLQLYLHGYVVYLAGRSKMRCMKSIKELEQEAIRIREEKSNGGGGGSSSSSSRSNGSLGELRFLELDLASLDSVLAAAAHIRSTERNLDVLINNAGVMGLPITSTHDAFELQLQTNYVSQFLLTTKLLPLLERTADLYRMGTLPECYTWASRATGLRSGTSTWG